MGIDPVKKQVQCRATCQDVDSKVRAGVSDRIAFSDRTLRTVVVRPTASQI